MLSLHQVLGRVEMIISKTDLFVQGIKKRCRGLTGCNNGGSASCGAMPKGYQKNPEDHDGNRLFRVSYLRATIIQLQENHVISCIM